MNIDAVDVKLRLTILKPLHAQWVVDFYNEMATVKGKPITENGWRAAGITDINRLGSKNLPGIDPFHDIDTLLDGNTAAVTSNLWPNFGGKTNSLLSNSR